MDNIVPGAIATLGVAVVLLFMLGFGRNSMSLEITHMCDFAGKFAAPNGTVYTCAKEKKP